MTWSHTYFSLFKKSRPDIVELPRRRSMTFFPDKTRQIIVPLVGPLCLAIASSAQSSRGGWSVVCVLDIRGGGPMAGMKKKISHTTRTMSETIKTTPPPTRTKNLFVRSGWNPRIVTLSSTIHVLSTFILKSIGVWEKTRHWFSLSFFFLLCALQQRCRCKTRQVYDISTCLLFTRTTTHRRIPSFFSFSLSNFYYSISLSV